LWMLGRPATHNVHLVYDHLQPGRRCAGQTSVSGQVID
jgi:hypothetical protein